MNWVCEDAWKAPFSQSMFFTGAIIGCFFFGWTSDTFGRYPTLLATNIILGIGGICLPLCNDFYCFAAVRFIMGTTFNTFFIIAQILGEICYTKWLFQTLDKTFSILFSAIEYTPTEKRYLTAVARAIGMGVAGSSLPWVLKLLEDWKMFHHVIFIFPFYVLLSAL